MSSFRRNPATLNPIAHARSLSNLSVASKYLIGRVHCTNMTVLMKTTTGRVYRYHPKCHNVAYAATMVVVRLFIAPNRCN